MTKKAETITTFTPLIGGVIHVTGEHDVGKTTFALECGAAPSRILFVDDDGKGRATVEQIKRDTDFGRYVDFTAETKNMPQLDMFNYGSALIDSIKPGDFDAIVWDTWTRFASSFKAHVRKNPHLFREPKDWAPRGDMKGAQQWKEAQLLEAAKLAQLNELAPVVMIVTHLKSQYIGNKRTGKQIPDASRTINRVPVLRVWLRRNPSGSPVPVGLVLKRINEKRYVEGVGLRTMNILPLRIQSRPWPDDESVDASLWDTVRWYLDNPIGNREPKEYETPNEFEQSLIDGTLTEDQKRAWLLQLQADAGEEEEMEELSGELLDDQQFVHDMREDGASDPEIVVAMQGLGKSYVEIAAAFGNGFTVPEIIAMVREKDKEKSA